MSARKDKYFFIIAKNARELYCPMSDDCFNGNSVSTSYSFHLMSARFTLGDFG